MLFAAPKSSPSEIVGVGHWLRLLTLRMREGKGFRELSWFHTRSIRLYRTEDVDKCTFPLGKHVTPKARVNQEHESGQAIADSSCTCMWVECLVPHQAT